MEKKKIRHGKIRLVSMFVPALSLKIVDPTIDNRFNYLNPNSYFFKLNYFKLTIEVSKSLCKEC